MLAENLVALGFLVVCFLLKINPNPQKNCLLWEKVAQNAAFKPDFFLGWVGLGFGEFVGFVIIFICFPT